MVYHDRRGGLLRLQQEARGQAHANCLFRLEQLEQLGLVFQVGARWITERVARATVFLMEQVADFRRILTRDAQLLPHVLVMELGQRLRRKSTRLNSSHPSISYAV